MAPGSDSMAYPRSSAVSTRAYPCPCCGFLSFSDPPGSYTSCEICLWTDDPSQLRFPEARGGANRESLIQAQENFRSFGASERRRLPDVRGSGSEDERDQGWRLWDRTTDDTGRSPTSAGYGMGYPTDTTKLYYWRNTYWGRKAK